MANITNAKDEVLDHLKYYSKSIKCAQLKYNGTDYVLKQRSTTEEFNNFLDLINFNYDAGWGCQELYGILWYTDGTWSDRYEYDGSECWDYHEVPEIPEHLKG